MEQPEALRLADALEDDLTELGVWGQDIADNAAAKLRRQHALITELVEALEGMAAMWVSVCNPRGWEPDHMTQYRTARAALSKSKEQ